MDKENSRLQLNYFKHMDHTRRFIWQTEDTFVREQEYETMRPLFDVIRNVRARAQRPLRILETGCGEGVNIIHLSQMGITKDDAVFEGVDISAESVTEAVQHGITASVADGLTLPYGDASFDVVYTHDVLHHLADDDERKRFFAEMKRVAKSDGAVVIIEPNPLNPMIFGLAILVKAERGLLTGEEKRLTRLLPGSQVFATCPTAAWRGWYHYRSPLRNWAPVAAVTRALLHIWGAICRHLPTTFWAWRVYVWDFGATGTAIADGAVNKHS